MTAAKVFGYSDPIRLGIDAAGQPITMDLFRTPASLLLTGSTRSGKSNMLYVLLKQLVGLPVRVAGVDPSGIVFNALGHHLGYTLADEESPDSPSLRVSTLRDTKKVVDVLDLLVQEMDRRIDLLLEEGSDKFTMRAFNSMPLTVIVLEELPGMIAQLSNDDTAQGRRGADRLEPKTKAALQRLAMEGAKVGMVLWVVAQRADASVLSGPFRAQLTRKISFRQDSDGLKMIHPEITLEQIQQAQRFKPGQGFVEFVGELPLTVFKADHEPYDDFRLIFA